MNNRSPRATGSCPGEAEIKPGHVTAELTTKTDTEVG